MNEKDIAKQLAAGKKIHLSEKKTAALKATLLQQIAEEYPPKKRTFFSPAFPVLLACLMLVVIAILAILPPVRTQLSPAVYGVRIALASNHYEKTEISFEEALQNFRNEHAAGNSLAETMAATRVTNQYISELHLQGEKGKYTSDQCKRLYQQYVGFLSLLQEEMKQTKHAQFAAEVTNYQQAAHTRLSFYKS